MIQLLRWFLDGLNGNPSRVGSGGTTTTCVAAPAVAAAVPWAVVPVPATVAAVAAAAYPVNRFAHRIFVLHIHETKLVHVPTRTNRVSTAGLCISPNLNPNISSGMCAACRI